MDAGGLVRRLIHINIRVLQSNVIMLVCLGGIQPRGISYEGNAWKPDERINVEHGCPTATFTSPHLIPGAVENSQQAITDQSPMS